MLTLLPDGGAAMVFAATVFAALVFSGGTGGVARAGEAISTSTHPSGGEIITMLLHLGHSRICPMASFFRTEILARHVVQETENSAFSKMMRLLLAAAGRPTKIE